MTLLYDTLTWPSSGTQITHTDTSCANTNITAATLITLSDTSSADTNIIEATQITHTSSADTNKTAATQITLSDTSSADTNIIAATQITLTDTSSADANITAATQITLIDTCCANTNITAATQITLTDTCCANTNITAATQITLTDTCCANTNITAATNSPLDTLSGPHQTHSPLWRALRGYRKRLRTVAVANAKLGEHSLTPRPPSETGTLATHSGKTILTDKRNTQICNRLDALKIQFFCIQSDGPQSSLIFSRLWRPSCSIFKTWMEMMSFRPPLKSPNGDVWRRHAEVFLTVLLSHTV